MKKNNQEQSEAFSSGGKTVRKLSYIRVFFAFVVVCGISYAIFVRWQEWHQQEAQVSMAPVFKPWFAAYVDVTATPSYAFEQLGSTSARDAVLSFIVSSKENPCNPSWGTYFDMEQASVNLDLDRRIARLQQQGGKIAISFGGALNSELSLECTDQAKLYESYKSVIERYNINTIDFDLENKSLSDEDAALRRAQAIAALQKDYHDSGKSLAVWLTLPVAPTGLTQEGTNAVAKMLSHGVDIAGVNIMTMDYGLDMNAGQSMLDMSKSAMTETYRQLDILYKQAEINLDSETLWRKIGATPMVGQNDFVGEVFTIDDAKGLNEFSLEKGIGRMSMWSANRDIPCGENYVDVKVVSDSCSGVKTPEKAFAQELSNGFEGNLEQNAGILTISDSSINVPVVDNPKNSPYQIWKETGAYPKGVKVVWHGNVYEAKWWTKNDLPDNPVLQSWQTPWQLVGPVLPGEKLIQQKTLPPGTYPEWSGENTYNGGEIILFEGIPFQAKWWNNGESPAASAANPDNSPWIPLTQKQIEEMLKGNRR